jgi:hypothetical protein
MCSAQAWGMMRDDRHIIVGAIREENNLLGLVAKETDSLL